MKNVHTLKKSKISGKISVLSKNIGPRRYYRFFRILKFPISPQKFQIFLANFEQLIFEFYENKNLKIFTMKNVVVGQGNLLLCKRDYLRLFGSTGYCSACNKVRWASHCFPIDKTVRQDLKNHRMLTSTHSW